MLIKLFVPSNFMEAVVPIIKKPWDEVGSVNFLLKNQTIRAEPQLSKR